MYPNQDKDNRLGKDFLNGSRMILSKNYLNTVIDFP